MNRRNLFSAFIGFTAGVPLASASKVNVLPEKRVICGMPVNDLQGRAFCTLAPQHNGEHLPAEIYIRSE